MIGEMIIKGDTEKTVPGLFRGSGHHWPAGKLHMFPQAHLFQQSAMERISNHFQLYFKEK
jgi:hypothetical protein